MALCVCKCLNVTLESNEVQDNVDIKKLELSSIEQRELFFNEKLLHSSVSALKIHVEQSALIEQRVAGRWTLHSCLACGVTTHAILNDRNESNKILIAKATQTTTEHINRLKDSSNFSPVFNLIVPELTTDIDMKENVDTSNLLNSKKKLWPPTLQVISVLSKQLTQTLESKLEEVEETVRQFREQKYTEYEAYKEKAQRDHNILASIISKAQRNVESDLRVDTTIDNGPPSPHLPPTQRRRLSSIKDAKKITQNFKQPKKVPSEEDSLDAEDLFDLEDIDPHHNISDQDYDSDDGSGAEAGAARGRARAGLEAVARSLPMNMPNFPGERSAFRDLDDDEEPAQDIAASIKALARSVHSDVFELPRPRFSTQI